MTDIINWIIAFQSVALPTELSGQNLDILEDSLRNLKTGETRSHIKYGL